jgi:beta-mannosidase
MGTMYWQLNDCWPVVSWSSRDYFGKKKALQYALKQAYGQVMISPVVENGHIKVWINSDDLQPNKAIMTVKVLDFNGNVLSDEGFNVDIPENSSLVYYDTLQSVLLGNLNAREVVLQVTLQGAANSLLQKNKLFYFVSPKDLALQNAVIEKKITKTPAGYNIRLNCDKLVKNLQLSTTVKGDFSDNYFDLLPGKPVDIQFKTTVKNAKTAEKITVRSLIDTY